MIRLPVPHSPSFHLAQRLRLLSTWWKVPLPKMARMLHPNPVAARFFFQNDPQDCLATPFSLAPSQDWLSLKRLPSASRKDVATWAGLSETGSLSLCSFRNRFSRHSPTTPTNEGHCERIWRPRAGCEIREIRRFSGGQKWGASRALSIP